MFFLSRFRNLKIRTKLNFLVSLIFIFGTLLSGVIFWTMIEQRAEAQINAKASVLVANINAVRNYTQDRINPLLKERIETESQFTPEIIPTFAARETFEYFRKVPGYENFIFKDAAPSPLNLRDQADEFETNLVNEFTAQPISQKSGWREFSEGKVFYTARPFVLKEQRCLECHSNPEIAPPSLLATYGTKHGFGWKLNEIVAVQIVYVPAQAILAGVRHSFVITLGTLIGVFAILAFFINLLLKRTITQRIQRIAQTAQAISRGEMDVTFEEHSRDEIGLLVIAFNRMKQSVELAMKLLSEKDIR